MNRRQANVVLALLLLLTVGFGHSQMTVSAGSRQDEPVPTGPVGSLKPVVAQSLHNDVSPPLRSLTPMAPTQVAPSVKNPNPILPKASGGEAAIDDGDPVLDASPTVGDIPSPIANFEGIDNRNFVLPPDTQGDVGPNHYVQWVNLSFAVYNKTTGAVMLGPINGNQIWTGFGGVCETTNHGDPIVLYDHLADRWFISQLSYPGGASGYHACIAISTTPDPTGTWFRYDFLYSSVNLNDYPKFGVWPDGYYMTANQFANGSSWAGAGVMAFERDKMLLGQTAQTVYFNLFGVNPNFGGMLPSDLDGPPPPAGSPNYFLEMDDSAWIPPADAIRLWKFAVNWTTPGSSTFGLAGQPNAVLDTAPFAPMPCVNVGSRDCIPQPPPGTASSMLDALGDRLMHRVQYRNFGTHESLVANNTVDAGSGRAGVRWYEIRSPNGTPTIFQQGTYAPADTEHRWMASLAMDAGGNIGLGYSASSLTVFPSIRYTGRLSGDPAGTMPQGEGSFIAGTGSQTHTASRWGDYSMMSVDPTDGCTFYYTQEYLLISGSAPWRTRIGSFKFPSCSAGPSGTLEGTVTDASNGNPILGAAVTAGASSTTTDAAGFYRFANIAIGTYDMTASKYGYATATATGVVVSANTTTTQDFALTPVGTVAVDGYVTDGSGADWPLYAKITVTAAGFPGATVWTDPRNGYYEIQLIQGTAYTFTAQAFAAGYNNQSKTVTVGPAGNTINFALTVNATTCNAPGYSFSGIALSQPFTATTAPPGWTVQTAVGPGWLFNRQPPRTNLTGGTGNFAIADSDFGGPGNSFDSTMMTPLIDVSTFSQVTLEYRSDFLRYSPLPEEICDTDISIDGGATWQNVLRRTGASFRGPRLEVIPINQAAGQNDLKVRFHFYNSVYDFWWEVDDVKVHNNAIGCTPQFGGMVVGLVTDDNTDLPINGATVSHDLGGSTLTVPTPLDPNLSDGYYQLFTPIPPGSGPATRTFTVSKQNYGTTTAQVVPVPNGVLWQPFVLGAGQLLASPVTVTMRLPGDGRTGSATMTLTNSGSRDVNVKVNEFNVPYSGPPAYSPRFDESPLRVPEKNQRDVDARAVIGYVPPAAPVLPNAGEVISSFPTTGAAGPWGIGFNANADDLWISDIPPLGGNNTDKRFTKSGTNTGDSIPTAFGGSWAADLAHDPGTNKLWQVNVGGDNCVYELDPVTKLATGNKICPAFGTTERGLAYNVATDTFYAGTWTNFTIVEFNRAGTILRSKNTGLAISGLAYNANTGHLFVMVNASSASDVYVLDVNADFAVVGSFAVAPMDNFSQAGLEIDCAGHLWAVKQTTDTVYEINSGETGACAIDIPWLSLPEDTFTIAPGESVDVQIDFTTAGQSLGLKRAQLAIQHDTPYLVPNVKVNFTVAFLDVPAGSFGDNFIHGLAGAGITQGCGNRNFCPADNMLRNVMAIWLIRGIEGSAYQPPPATGLMFDDVPAESFAADWIEELARREITGGCQVAPPLYCPTNAVLRAQMAVFLLRSLEGSDYVPPPAIGIFADVPPSDFFAPWIEELYNRAITGGCATNPLRYCPGASVLRSQMAIFMVRTFSIPALP